MAKFFHQHFLLHNLKLNCPYSLEYLTLQHKTYGDFFADSCYRRVQLIEWPHRVITVIEVQRQVILGSTALFTTVWQLRIHDDRDEGWENF